jgi:hypothetical protein
MIGTFGSKPVLQVEKLSERLGGREAKGWRRTTDRPGLLSLRFPMYNDTKMMG